MSSQHCFLLRSPVSKCRARWGAQRCWWPRAPLVSKSERPSGDPSGPQRSSWPRFSGAPWRLCTAPASWAEPSCTATSAWSSSRWSPETAATSLCFWWTQEGEPGPRSCSSQCTVSAAPALAPCPATRHWKASHSWELGRPGFQRPLAPDLTADAAAPHPQVLPGEPLCGAA